MGRRRRGGEWGRALLFYLLILSMLAAVGFLAKPYITDMLHARKADPIYIPVNSEKRELALSAAQDKPSEKDAKALVEMAEKAELRNVDMRGPEDYLLLSTHAWRR